MRKELIICDQCTNEDAYGVSYIADRQQDGAGSMDDVEISMDLCYGCIAAVLHRILHFNKYNSGLAGLLRTEGFK